MKSERKLCIYHGNCADGFGSAWVFHHCAGDEFDFYPGVYQSDPPDVEGRDVYLVDFSYKRPVVEQIVERANRVVLIDHHKTAIDDLKPLVESGAIEALVDTEHSGAMLAWKWWFGGSNQEPPQLLKHIEDRDLWRFRYPETRAIQAAVFSYPYDLQTWDWLMLEADLDQLRVEGEAIERKHHKDVAELTKVVTRMMKIAGHEVPIANLPYTLTSDAGHLLCGEVQCPPGIGGPTISQYPFAGCYWDTPDGRVFSLRSREDGFDVGEIAKEYGGGGYKHASGFRIPFDQLAQFEP